DVWDEGNALLGRGRQYWRTLTAARMGTLPFFILACTVVYLWSRRWFAPGTALIAVFLFSTLPPVLGHAGLATNDMACCATVLLAAYCLMRWFEEPSLARSAWLSVALALAVLAKLSALFFVPACAVAMVLAYAIEYRPDWATVSGVARRYVPRLIPILAVTLVLIWGGYRFSVKPLNASDKFAKVEQQVPALHKIASVPLPLTELLLGMAHLVHHNDEGHESFVLGHTSKHGWWYFFLVVLAVKTPLGLLILALLGVVLSRRWIAGDAPRLATLLCAALILMIAMSTRINLGVRHILPIYPFLVIIAAQAVVYLTSGPRPRWVIATVAALLALDLAHTTMAGIDQLPYFNPIAGSRPERVLCESDLDWGQDLHRLSERLWDRGIHHIALAYFGTAQLETAGLPDYTTIDGKAPVTGYIAVSARNLSLATARDGSFAWLRDVPPNGRIGRSIYLFYIPPESH
ncbi:MAG TPA: glycosyltransferase family 39 protein, partial [Candidatus Acidoferrum sp.]|nr:glycosyltransferase family 39 protein [Candidatus Acidoferrum sp.]